VNEKGDLQAFGIYPARIVIDAGGNPTSYVRLLPMMLMILVPVKVMAVTM